jgi:hypothetical protein
VVIAPLKYHFEELEAGNFSNRLSWGMSLRISGQLRFHILIRGETIMPLSRHIRETIDNLPLVEDV